MTEINKTPVVRFERDGITSKVQQEFLAKHIGQNSGFGHGFHFERPSENEIVVTGKKQDYPFDRSMRVKAQ